MGMPSPLHVNIDNGNKCCNKIKQAYINYINVYYMPVLYESLKTEKEIQLQKDEIKSCIVNLEKYQKEINKQGGDGGEGDEGVEDAVRGGSGSGGGGGGGGD